MLKLPTKSKPAFKMVQAAVVSTWGQPPSYKTIDLPEPSDSQVRIKVVAAGLHNFVRSRASGQHFSVAHLSPPHVPGSDGVGAIVPSGTLAYFNALGSPTGSFAEEINVDKKDVFPLPNGADPNAIAVLVNPVMSSWMALTTRAGIVPGQEKEWSVAIIGATGVSGQPAVQVARAMGASKVVAIGKPGAKLEKTKELGATSTIALGEGADFSDAADVDVVLDYIWGDVAEKVLPGIIAKRKNKSQRLSYVEIGAVAGDNSTVSGALLRQANLVFLGCGPGSWSFAELGQQVPHMLKAMVDGGLKADYKVENLEDVEKWWNEVDGPRKLVNPTTGI